MCTNVIFAVDNALTNDLMVATLKRPPAAQIEESESEEEVIPPPKGM